ncbi:MAG: DUF3422 domain-containing protein [Rhodospirillum sp.]|nr:DUF3422 domain-containing protein [Rhodospirillum sp.]MCF8491977.1 DUF3422 domain-containing protein [Rhodospirillum sp.]MCF8501319.1 DUF3422 domain-containing protein [Rhodospirillum sp.]
MATPPFPEHPLRETLASELHTRPSEAIEAPAQLTHLAVMSSDPDALATHLATLCGRLGGPAPAPGASHFAGDIGTLRVRFEKHTEFCSLTFIRRGMGGEFPFEKPVLSELPEEWLASLPGQVLTGVHLVLESRDEVEYPPENLSLRHFAGNQVIGSLVGGGAGKAYSDLRMHGDRCNRILLRDVDLNPRHAGRIVQRLLEVNTYRALALLAFPEARSASPALRKVDTALADLSARMADPTSPGSDADLLSELSTLTAKVEAIAASRGYRLAASRAYYDLVQRRLEELRTDRLEGLITFAGFLERRLAPAMATCQSVTVRLEELSVRCARSAALLRARVEVDLQAQNKDLLASMDRRAKVQLRLQEAVEGLSVVAISYYLVGLVGYLAKGIKAAGWSFGGAKIDSSLVTGVAVPLVVALVYLGLRRAKKAMGAEE